MAVAPEKLVTAVAAMLVAAHGNEDGKLDALRKLSLAVNHSRDVEERSCTVLRQALVRHPAYREDFATIVLSSLVQLGLVRRLVVRKVCEVLRALVAAPGWRDALAADASILDAALASAELCAALGVAESFEEASFQDVDPDEAPEADLRGQAVSRADPDEADEPDADAEVHLPELQGDAQLLDQAEPGAADGFHGTQDCEKFIWMYGDHLLGPVARLNPVRWSRRLGVEELVAELEALPDQRRPLRIQGSHGMRFEFDSAAEAVANLKGP